MSSALMSAIAVCACIPLQLTAMSSRLKQREIALHLSGQLRTGIPLDGILIFSAGPTVFRVEQDYAVGLAVTERGFPFDDVDIQSTTAERQVVTAFGYHISVDAIFDVTGRYGVGVLARYTRASPSVTLRGEAQPALDLGQLQVLGGLRIGF